MTKALTNNYLAFVVACLCVTATFITATNFTQLGLAIVLYPILMFAAYRMYNNKPKPATEKIIADESATTESGRKPLEKIVISDIDKRVFLKLIGSAGLFLFLFSLFNKKAENMFYKSLPERGRAFFDKKENSDKSANVATQPTDEYGISEIESGDTSYYGYTKLGGAWYIMKVDTATNSFRYVRGDQNFPDGWKKRTKLKYDYFGNVF